VFKIKKIDKPINHSLIAKTHPPLFMGHKYWSRKPVNVIRKYIEHFTNEGDIVCDPFTGSGVTNVASLELKRRTIGVDINPLAIFITRMTANHTNISLLTKNFEDIKQRLNTKIEKLYEIKCPHCLSSAQITHTIIEKFFKINKSYSDFKSLEDKDKEIVDFLNKQKKDISYSSIKNNFDFVSTYLTKKLNNLEQNKVIISVKKPVECKIKCMSCNEYKFYNVSEAMAKEINSNSKKVKAKWYPKDELFENSRLCAYKSMKVIDLFTKRNVVVLSLILDEIEKIKNNEIKEILRYVFSSTLPQASNLVFVIEQRGRNTGKISKTKEVGSWTLPSFTIMARHFEINAWNCFNQRFSKVINAKQEANYEIPIFEELPLTEFRNYHKLTSKLPSNNPEKIKYFKRLFEKYNLAIIWSTLDLNFIPNNSIDYIFTDPPYGDSIPYLELSLFFNSWLNYKDKYPEFKPDYDDEIIVTDSNVRKEKNLKNYKELLTIAFKEIYRILKPDSWISLTFHNRDIETWNALITSAQDAGLTYINDVYQVPARASAKSGLSKSGSMTGDMIVNFRKIENKNILKTLKEEDIEKICINEANSIMHERYGKASEDQLMRGIIHILLRNELTKKIENPKNYIQNLLKSNYIKKGNNWCFKEKKDDSKVIPLKENIEQLIRGVLSKRGGATFDEILARLFSSLKNGHTPESKDINEVLNKIAETKKDLWVLKGQKQLDADKLISPKEEKKRKAVEIELSHHNKCIETLAKLAEIIKLNKTIGNTELKANACLRSLHDILSNTGIPIDALNEIREIDILFSKNKVIQACFEIEFSTLKTEKFLSRFRTLREVTPNMNIPLFVVIQPNNERAIKKILLKRGNLNIDVSYIFDVDIFTLYDKVINHNLKLEFDHLKKISHKVEKQKLLSED